MCCLHFGTKLLHSKAFLVGALVLTLFLSFILFASVSAKVPQLQWSKKYGLYSGSAVIETVDGGYAVTGTYVTYSTHGITSYSALLIKTDDKGESQWRKTYSNTIDDSMVSVMQSNDSSYALSGQGGWLLKLDTNGNVQWNKTYGEILPDYGVPLLQTIAIQTSDGGYVLAGLKPDPSFMDTVLVRTNPDGFELWNKTFSTGQLSDVRVEALMETDDGGYALTGAYGGHFWLGITDSIGNLLVNQTYDVSNDVSWSSAFAKASDDGYILAGGDRTYAWLVKVDSLGEMQWKRSYTTYPNVFFRSVVQTSDGGYLTTDYDKLLKVDASGNIQGTTDSLAAEVYDIIVTKDGGYAATGVSTNETGFAAVWLAKFASESTIIDVLSTPTSWLIVTGTLVAVAVIISLAYLKKRKR